MYAQKPLDLPKLANLQNDLQMILKLKYNEKKKIPETSTYKH